MDDGSMNLKILLPHQVFSEADDVTAILAEGRSGFFGLLPRRLDCVAALSPGIFRYTALSAGEVYLAIDEGILVKKGRDVLVSVRSAVGGVPLEQLHEVVIREFTDLDEREQNVRTVLKKMESGFIERLARYYHGK